MSLSFCVVKKMLWTAPLLAGMVILPTLYNGTGGLTDKQMASIKDKEELNQRLNLWRSDVKMFDALAVKDNKARIELMKRGKALEAELKEPIRRINVEGEDEELSRVISGLKYRYDITCGLYEVAVRLVASYAIHTKSRSAGLFVLLSPFINGLVLKIAIMKQERLPCTGDDTMWHCLTDEYLLNDNFYLLKTISIIYEAKNMYAGVDEDWTKILFFIMQCTAFYYCCMVYIVCRFSLRPKVPSKRTAKPPPDSIPTVNSHTEPPQKVPKHSKSRLYNLCIEGDMAKLRRYIKEFSYKININDVISKDGNTVLHMASENGRAEAVEVLIQEFDKKIDYELKNKNSHTALELAVIKGRVSVVNAFIRRNRFPKNPDRVLKLAKTSKSCNLKYFLIGYLCLTESEKKAVDYEAVATKMCPELKSTTIENESGSKNRDVDVFDFRCTKCTKIMESPMKIYGCTQDHLICNACLTSYHVKKCNICGESFEQNLPKRRVVAEKLISLLLD